MTQMTANIQTLKDVGQISDQLLTKVTSPCHNYRLSLCETPTNTNHPISRAEENGAISSLLHYYYDSNATKFFPLQVISSGMHFPDKSHEITLLLTAWNLSPLISTNKQIFPIGAITFKGFGIRSRHLIEDC